MQVWWGGGGEVELLTEKKIFAKKCSWGLKTHQKNKKLGGGGEKFLNFFSKNVPGVLKRMQKKIIFQRGGGDFGVFGGAPRPHLGVARGQKTIHFFL